MALYRNIWAGDICCAIWPDDECSPTTPPEPERQSDTTGILVGGQNDNLAEDQETLALRALVQEETQ